MIFARLAAQWADTGPFSVGDVFPRTGPPKQTLSTRWPGMKDPVLHAGCLSFEPTRLRNGTRGRKGEYGGQLDFLVFETAVTNEFVTHELGWWRQRRQLVLVFQHG